MLVACGPHLRLIDVSLHWPRELIEPTADEHPNASLMDLVQLTAERLVKKPHEVPNFGARSSPVFGRERVDAQDLDAEVLAAVHDTLDRLDTGSMAEGVRTPPLSCPAPVAIHDDADVTGALSRWRRRARRSIPPRPSVSRGGPTKPASCGVVVGGPREGCFAVRVHWRGDSRGSDLQHLGFFTAGYRVDLLRVGVSDLLQLVTGALGRVFRDFASPLLMVDAMQLVAPHVAYRNAGFLGALPDHLDVFPTALLGQGRDRNSDDLSVVRGIEAHSRVADGLFDGTHLPPVVHLHGQKPRLGSADLSQLVELRRCPVVGHHDPLDQRRVGSARTDGGKAVLEVLDRPIHL